MALPELAKMLHRAVTLSFGPHADISTALRWTVASNGCVEGYESESPTDALLGFDERLRLAPVDREQ